jgi:hypothetical protein
MLAWHQSQPGHELPRIFKAGDIPDLGHDCGGDCRVYAAQRSKRIHDRGKMPAFDSRFNCLVQRCNTCLDLVDGTFELLERYLLVWIWKLAQFSQPPAVALS